MSKTERIAAIIQAQRQALGLSRNEVASALNLSKSAYSKAERCEKVYFTAVQIIQLCRILRLSPNMLFDWDNYKGKFFKTVKPVKEAC